MRFRVPLLPLDGGRFVRVKICASKTEMRRDVRNFHGHKCHRDERGCTIVEPEPGDPWIPGMIADMFLIRGHLDAGTISHESGHAARATMRALGIGVAEDSEEREMKVLDRLVTRIHKALS